MQNNFLLILCAACAVLGCLEAASALSLGGDTNSHAALTAQQAHRSFLAKRAAPVTHRRSTLGVDVVPVSHFDNTPDDDSCISTPEEFMRAWRSRNGGDRDRCVDPNIVIRLYVGNKACEKALSDLLEKFLKRLTPLSFWSNKDGPVKYLRIGIPHTVGSYVDGVRRKQSNTEPDNANWANSEFPGVRDKSNGVSLLTQIGFGSDIYRIDLYYMMFVGYRNKTYMDTQGVPTFVATWSNLATFYQDFVREQIVRFSLGRPEDFTIPKEVATGGSGFPGLDNIELGDLTGCPSQCTFEDIKYPLPVNSSVGGKAYPAVTPAALANHTAVGGYGPETCGMPVLNVPKDPSNCSSDVIDVGPRLRKAGRLQLAEPTQLSINEYSCRDPDWKRYYLLGDFLTTPNWTTVNSTPVFQNNKFPGLYEICNKERKFPGPLYMSAFLKEWYKLGAGDIKKKAVLFRAFLTTGCVGNFNQLFSGNGMVYTGFGGVSSVTVSELLLGGIADGNRSIAGDSKLLGDYAYSFFCLDGSEECCPDRNCRKLGKPAWG